MSTGKRWGRTSKVMLISATRVPPGPRPREKVNILSSLNLIPQSALTDIFHFDKVKDRHNLEYSKALWLIDMAAGYPVIIPLLFNPNEIDIKSAFFTRWVSIFGAPSVCLLTTNEFGTIIQATTFAVKDKKKVLYNQFQWWYLPLRTRVKGLLRCIALNKPHAGRCSTKLLHNTRENLICKLTQVLGTTTKRLPKP